MSRWVVHTLGCMQVMASFGGIERLSYFYPHLHVPFFHVAHLETVRLLAHNLMFMDTYPSIGLDRSIAQHAYEAETGFASGFGDVMPRTTRETKDF